MPAIDSAKASGLGPVRTALVIESSILLLASAGYITRAMDMPDERGLYESGLLLLGVGGVVALFSAPVMLSVDRYRDDFPELLIMCGAAMLAGGYHLYLHANRDLDAPDIFRTSLVSLNAAALTSWLLVRSIHR
jgi:hypothetical protein